VNDAFWYLVLASGRNRLRIGLRRARSPRYAIALIIGGLYIWSFLLRPATSIGGTSFLLGQGTEMLVTLVCVLTLMGSWLFGSDATALAFSEAEVSLLFPAPLSRRALIGYKLFRSQLTVLLNALVWVFILRRGGTVLPSPLRAAGLWVLFSVLNLHRIGAALVRSSWSEHGSAALRRHWASVGIFGAVGVLVITGLVRARNALFGTVGLKAFFASLGRILSSSPAYWGLYPFHLVVAPTFAQTPAEWARLIGPALIVLVVHFWWVMRTDAAFEDAALVASAERAKRGSVSRARRATSMGAPRPATSTIPLAATGSASGAILWKNMLCLRRTAQLRVFIGPATVAISLGAATSSTGADGAEILASSALAFAGMMLLFGGRLIRNDLRHDMQHLPLIKSLPVSPTDIVLAEVASSSLPMAAIQFLMVAFAYVAATASPENPLGSSVRLAILVASPVALVALNGALMTIQNGTAVLFPDWIRLGPVVSSGVEALGQNVLAMMASLISLFVGLIVPLGVAFGIVSLFSQGRAEPMAIAAIVASVLLLGETYVAIRAIGRALGRAEPAQTA
jgi:hypothetical protein